MAHARVYHVRYSMWQRLLVAAHSNGITVFNSELKPLAHYPIGDGAHILHVCTVGSHNKVAYTTDTSPNGVFCHTHDQPTRTYIDVGRVNELDSIDSTVMVIRAKSMCIVNGDRIVEEWDTAQNDLCAYATNHLSHIAYPHIKEGYVTMWHYGSSLIRRVTQAHQNTIACMALSRDASMLATCSTRGTLVRLFSTNDMKPLTEYRVGYMTTVVRSLQFHPCDESISLVCGSSIHVFTIDVPREQPLPPTSLSVPDPCTHTEPTMVASSWYYMSPLKDAAASLLNMMRLNVPSISPSSYVIQVDPTQGNIACTWWYMPLHRLSVVTDTGTLLLYMEQCSNNTPAYSELDDLCVTQYQQSHYACDDVSDGKNKLSLLTYSFVHQVCPENVVIRGTLQST